MTKVLLTNKVEILKAYTHPINGTRYQVETYDGWMTGGFIMFSEALEYYLGCEIHRALNHCK